MTFNDFCASFLLLAALLHAAGFAYVGSWVNAALAILYVVLAVWMFEGTSRWEAQQVSRGDRY